MSRPTQEPRFEIRNPLIIMFETEPDHSVVTHLYPSARCDRYEAYGLLVCDLVRHIANKFNVTEEEVWVWVDKERYHPTTHITRPA